MRYAPTLKEVSLFSRVLSCYRERSFALHFFGTGVKMVCPIAIDQQKPSKRQDFGLP